MCDDNKLKKILKTLFENNDEVPNDWEPRCRELDWFSSGIKDNIVAFIYREMFDEPIAKRPASPLANLALPTIEVTETGEQRVIEQPLR